MTRHDPHPKLLTWALIAIFALLPSVAQARNPEKLARKVRRAEEVYEELLSARDRTVPERLLKKAECIAVFPNVIKGAIGWGGRHGRGVVSCRGRGGWSAPAFFQISGGSFGLQIGGESSDLVLFFLTEKSARSLLKSKSTLGADASVAAGPIGRTAEAGTDLRMNAEILAYSKAKGLFAGISLEGGRLAPDRKANAAYYGESLSARGILFEGRARRVPAEARSFQRALP